MLGDDLAAALPGLQAQAESTMRTPCIVQRPIGVDIDPETGVDTSVYADVHDGLCKLQERDLQTGSAAVPGATVPVARLEVQFPVSVGPFDIDDVVRILDADGVEIRSVRITGLHVKTWQTAQRLPVEEWM